MTINIGITQRIVEEHRYKEVRDSLSHDWVEYLYKILPEINLIILPNNPSYVESLNDRVLLDGIILSSGNDWGEYVQRDITEKILFETYFNKNLPILGVCRGFQVINLLLGGSITTNLEEYTDTPHIAKDHSVSIIDKDFNHNNSNNLIVNSFHKQGILSSQLSDKCVEFAVSGDVIEGFFIPQKPIIAIQWHPERESESSDYTDNLIQNLFRRGK